VATDDGRENSRKSMVSVRLDPDEEAALRAEAAAAGENLSQYIRSLLIRRNDADSGTVDYHLYPVSYTGTPGSLALEAINGKLMPKTSQPYVSSLIPR
jgi:hypothetical protein